MCKRENKRRYREKHREEINARNREYRKKHQDEIKARRREQNKKKKEKQKEEHTHNEDFMVN